MAGRTEAEYAAYIRQGFAHGQRRAERHADDAWARARRTAEDERRRVREEEQERRRAADRERRREEKRRERRERDVREEMEARARERERAAPAAPASDWKKAQRERYARRWAALGRRIDEKGAERGQEEAGLEEVDMGFMDIPWPVYLPSAPPLPGEGRVSVGVEEMTKERIKAFVVDLVKDVGAGAGKRVVREAIRAFHSDRFTSRILPRVRETERVAVGQGGEAVVRALTGIMSEV
jgi:flagellar biosynthesis GTPase FlhF